MFPPIKPNFLNYGWLGGVKNAASWEVLRKQRSVYIAMPQKSVNVLTAASQKKVQFETLLEMLLGLRKQIADEQAIAPYMVFADSTLRLMAQMRPQTLAALRDIPGVVEYKVAQYGDRFISVIISYIQTQINPQNTARKYPKTTASGLPNATQIHPLKLY